MELESRRRERHLPDLHVVLPRQPVGALSTGFLPPRFSVVDINPDAPRKACARRKAIELLEERWRLLSLREIEREPDGHVRPEMAGYEDFYDTAHSL